MRNRGQLWIGLVFILLGVAYLAAVILGIDLRGSFWAVMLIVMGLMMLLLPAVSSTGADDFRLLGEVVQRGRWKVSSRSFWALIGDLKLDLTQADIPEGESVIQLNAFIGDIKMVAPPDLAIAIVATGFITDTRLFDEKQEGFFMPVDLRTPNYDSALRKVRLEAAGFITAVKVRAG